MVINKIHTLSVVLIDTYNQPVVVMLIECSARADF